MKIRLGYVAISKTLDSITTSSFITYQNFCKDKDFNYKKLSSIIQSNLKALIEILQYNIKNQIHFYRISSNLIPLATHRDVLFNYLEPYQTYYKKIGNLISCNQMRVDMHPSSYCVLNSVKQEVVDASVEILNYHYKLLNQMGISDKLVILHIGSNTFGKKNSLSRFIHSFQKLPFYLQEMIAIENDDKVFTIDDCLYLSKILKIPVVLDYHHFQCNHSNDDIRPYLKEIYQSWGEKIPKMHFSSPKNKKEFRAHHEFISDDQFISFIQILKEFDQDVDIMIEAKGKDEALFRLIRQLKYKTNYKFVDETSFLI